MVEEEKKKVSIHEKGGEFDDTLTIYDIEKALHPRAKEVITEELTELVDKVFKEHVKKGRIKDADKAADEFLELLAKYHFGDAYGQLKSDKKHMIETLKQKYGVSRNQLKSAFKKKGIYKTRDAFYKMHRDPLVEHAHRVSQEDAQQSLDTYLKDIDAKDEVVEHMEKRTGRKASESYRALPDLQTTASLIQEYMSLDGALEAIEKNKKAKLGLSEAKAGQPHLYEAFAKGEEYADAHQEEAKKAAVSHKLKTKK